MDKEEKFVLPDDITTEQAVEIIADILHAFSDQMNEQGIEEPVMLATLLTVYAERAADFGDRELYLEQLEAAIEEEWDEHTVH